MSNLKRVCTQCGADASASAGDYCQECCEHEFDPDEGFMCLDCGKDGAEDVMSAAYDKAKDERKYGK
jgi:hypothetical protein